MSVFNAVIDRILGWYFAAFGWSPGIGLAVLSLLAGVGMLWVFAKTSKPDRIRAVKRKVYAHLLELRVYGDEPMVMWRAQKSLLKSNLRYMALMLAPALWMALPVAILLVHLESYYGRAPLGVGQEAILTAGVRGGLDTAPKLEAPRGIAVETEPVRVLAENQVSWRLRPTAPVSGTLRLTIGGETVEKSIDAGGAARLVSDRRVSSAWDALWHPGEPVLASRNVEWAQIHYPGKEVELAGIRLHWLVWFLIFSMGSALLLKKRFRVVL